MLVHHKNGVLALPRITVVSEGKRRGLALWHKEHGDAEASLIVREQMLSIIESDDPAIKWKGLPHERIDERKTLHSHHERLVGSKETLDIGARHLRADRIKGDVVGLARGKLIRRIGKRSTHDDRIDIVQRSELTPLRMAGQLRIMHVVSWDTDRALVMDQLNKLTSGEFHLSHIHGIPWCAELGDNTFFFAWSRHEGLLSKNILVLT